MTDDERSHARLPDDPRWIPTHPFIGSRRNYYLSGADIDTIRLVVPGFQIGQYPWNDIRAFLIARCGITRDEITRTSARELLVMVRAVSNAARPEGERELPGPPRKLQPSRSPAMSLKQFGKALIMDPYRVFKPRALAEWDLKSDNEANTKWTIDYNLLSDPGKERQIEERADLLRDKEKKSSAT